MIIKTFVELVEVIHRAPSKYTRKIIAIDGGGGAGKTTFATELQKLYTDSFIISLDDFYRPPQLRVPVGTKDIVNENMDWDRFEDSVLRAVQKGDDVRYQLYDKQRGVLTDTWITVPSAAMIIIEGVWSMQKRFIDVYDYTIWIEASPAVRLLRGLERDGEDMRTVWEKEFIPIDERYRSTDKPFEQASIVIDSEQSDFFNGILVTL